MSKEKKAVEKVKGYKNVEFEKAKLTVDFIDTDKIDGDFLGRIKKYMENKDVENITLMFIDSIKNENGDPVARSTGAVKKLMESVQGFYLLDNITQTYYTVLAELKIQMREDFEKKYGKLEIG